jgi:hypothetical protein
MDHDEKQNQDQIERLLNSAWSLAQSDELLLSLRSKFEERLIELGVSSFQAEKNLGIDYKTLNRLLDGNLKKFDLLPLIKIGYFLDFPQEEIYKLFIDFLAVENKKELEQAKRSTFILNNFDLTVLKGLGVINSVSDFNHIENRINKIFGLKNILDYNADDIGAALSSTKVKPKNEKNRKYFKYKSRIIFKEINNPHRYDKQALVDYFPKIRWHSTDIDNGLINVIKSLYSLGVTVIFQPRIPLLQMRGATFEVNGKPCVVLTDYRGSYPTLWFAFLHELFHILFDWEEISQKRYHLSDEENDLIVIQHKEDEANDFAREYLFPIHKIELVSTRIKHPFFVKEFASDNHVHPSIIYANYAHQYSNDDNMLWGQLDKLIRPPMDDLIKKLSGGLSHDATAKEFANYYSSKIYNTIKNG